MYKSVEQVEKLRKEKLEIIRSVYQGKDPDAVYENQTQLGNMSLSIFTDVADVVLPVFAEDGVSNIVWPKTSRRLEKLSFISIPSAADICAGYKESLENPTVVKLEGAVPEPGVETTVKKIPLPAFLVALAVQGIAIPVLLYVLGGKKWALVKIVGGLTNAVCMVIEVVKYFDIDSKFRKKSCSSQEKKEPLYKTETINVAENPRKDVYEEMYKKAIEKTCIDNSKILNEWFDRLSEVLKEETEKELNQSEE